MTTATGFSLYGKLMETETGTELDRYAPEGGHGVEYQLITYLKYDFACRADESKKFIEQSLVKHHIRAFTDMAAGGQPSSLDIGCATGRYSMLFASMGYAACGFDIQDAAIAICRERARMTPNVRFEKKDILEEPVDERFHAVTCMMGTFDHIPHESKETFVRRVYDMLLDGGVFFLSCWNSRCPYTNYLQFYTREEREYLRDNTLSPDETRTLLEAVGFQIHAAEHFSFVPDACYEAWGSETSPEKVYELDRQLANQFSGRNSQMYLHVATKGVRP